MQRVALVKPEKAQLIEEHILKSAHMSGFSPANRISEDELINILSRVSLNLKLLNTSLMDLSDCLDE